MECKFCGVNKIMPRHKPYGTYICDQEHTQCYFCNTMLKGKCGVCQRDTQILVQCDDVLHPKSGRPFDAEPPQTSKTDFTDIDSCSDNELRRTNNFDDNSLCGYELQGKESLCELEEVLSYERELRKLEELAKEEYDKQETGVFTDVDTGKNVPDLETLQRMKCGARPMSPSAMDVMMKALELELPKDEMYSPPNTPHQPPSTSPHVRAHANLHAHPHAHTHAHAHAPSAPPLPTSQSPPQSSNSNCPTCFMYCMQSDHIAGGNEVQQVQPAPTLPFCYYGSFPPMGATTLTTASVCYTYHCPCYPHVCTGVTNCPHSKQTDTRNSANSTESSFKLSYFNAATEMKENTVTATSHELHIPRPFQAAVDYNSKPKNHSPSNRTDLDNNNGVIVLPPPPGFRDNSMGSRTYRTQPTVDVIYEDITLSPEPTKHSSARAKKTANNNKNHAAPVKGRILQALTTAPVEIAHKNDNVVQAMAATLNMSMQNAPGGYTLPPAIDDKKKDSSIMNIRMQRLLQTFQEEAATTKVEEPQPLMQSTIKKQPAKSGHKSESPAQPKRAEFKPLPAISRSNNSFSSFHDTFSLRSIHSKFDTIGEDEDMTAVYIKVCTKFSTAYRCIFEPVLDISTPQPQFQQITYFIGAPDELKETWNHFKATKNATMDQSKVLYFPIFCPEAKCHAPTFMSGLSKHLVLDHEYVMLERISPLQYKNFLFDVRLCRSGTSKIHTAFLVRDKDSEFSHDDFKGYLPVLLMSSRLKLSENFGIIAPEDEEDEFIVIWLTGDICRNPAITCSITVWASLRRMPIGLLGHSGSVYPIRSPQVARDVLYSGNMLLLSAKEINRLTNKMADMLKLQITVQT